MFKSRIKPRLNKKYTSFVDWSVHKTEYIFDTYTFFLIDLFNVFSKTPFALKNDEAFCSVVAVIQWILVFPRAIIAACSCLMTRERIQGLNPSTSVIVKTVSASLKPQQLILMHERVGSQNERCHLDEKMFQEVQY